LEKVKLHGQKVEILLAAVGASIVTGEVFLIRLEVPGAEIIDFAEKVSIVREEILIHDRCQSVRAPFQKRKRGASV
jgi:hypothetical protein